MAKPIAVQKLKHGKALCGKTFGGFVDTFNWLVDFCLSLQGDKDVNNANGTVTVDRSDPSAPVIRVAVTVGGEGGGEGGGSSAADRSCFRLVSFEVEEEGAGAEPTTEVHRFVVDCYYNDGGRTKRVDNTDIESLIPVPPPTPNPSSTPDPQPTPDPSSTTEEDDTSDDHGNTVIYFKISADGSTTFDKCTFGELNRLQSGATSYVFPLYLFDANGALVCDLRTAPQIQLFDVGLTADGQSEDQGGGS